MKIIKNVLTVIAVGLFVIGCGGLEDIGGGGGGGGGGGTGLSYLRVANSSSSTSSICNVYSNPSSSTTWGPDRLSGTIAPGYYRQFSTSNCNKNYDLKVVFCDGYSDTYNGYYRACGATRTITFRNW